MPPRKIVSGTEVGRLKHMTFLEKERPPAISDKKPHFKHAAKRDITSPFSLCIFIFRSPCQPLWTDLKVPVFD